MAKLNEYIGSIVTSIADARIMSDVQTAKIAEEYARHDLLKHFSIPRMRIEDVEMTIPVALDEVQEKSQRVYGPIDRQKFRSAAYKEIKQILGITSLPKHISKRIQEEIVDKVDHLAKNIQSSQHLGSLTEFSEDMALYISGLIERFSLAEKVTKRMAGPEEIQDSLEKKLSKEIMVEEEKKLPGDLNVIVEAHRLKEQKPENIIYIKLKVSEEGMEWSRMENSKGEVESRLLPE